MSDRRTNIAIVGAGPCGLAVGAAARSSDMRAVLFDRGPLCSSIVGYPPYLSFFSTPEKLELESLPFVTTERNPTRREALAYYRGVAEYFDLDIRQYHTVESIDRSGDDFVLRIRSSAGVSESWSTSAVVIATGGFDEPNHLDVPGEDLPKVSHYYAEAHPYWDQDVVVVGAGNSAVEAALELFRVGARVTLVHFGHDIDPGVKAWVVPDIRNRIEEGEIEVRWGCRVVEITPRSVVLRSEEGEVEELPNDWVLALTGWRPDTRLLRSLGVPVDRGTGIPSHDPETMETTVPGVYIAGVLAAGHDANKIFIENGRAHGRQIVDHLSRAVHPKPRGSVKGSRERP